MKNDSIIKAFRPQFANEAHMRIMKKIGEINGMRKLLEEKEAKKDANGIKLLKEKLEKAKKGVVSLIEYDKQTPQ